MACDIKKVWIKIIDETIHMVNINKFKNAPLFFFILCLITVLHAPYYHFHIKSNDTHTLDHEHQAGSPHSSSEHHSHNLHTGLSKTETLKAGHQNVWRHLHFTRELYRSRKSSQNDPERYDNFAVNVIRPFVTYNHTFSSTLTDSHKIKYSPKCSKTYSGLSPPVA